MIKIWVKRLYCVQKKGGYSCETIKSFTAHLAKAPQVDANLLLYNTLLFKYLIV